ncbi:MAG TPA: hypothetical protein VMG31_09110 [Verrucomicrobiae bacterium]|nr:hypothetical protein [Verrucomicrobiae bacterium]
MKQIVYSGMAIAVFVAAIGLRAGAQTQPTSNTQTTNSGQSLGDYARQVRKTSAPTSKAKVFDNDNLPKEDSLSIVGPPPEPTADASATKSDQEAAPASGDNKTQAGATSGSDTKTATAGTTDDKSGAPKAPEEDEAAKQAALKQWSDRISAQKDQISLLERELNVLQREYQIRAAAMYADAGNRLRNQADWDKQDADYKQKIADKQKDLDDAKQKLDDMEESARKAGVPDSVREP